MGLLAGFVFAALRIGLLLLPATRHRWPVKKIAAGGALVAAFFYLLAVGRQCRDRARLHHGGRGAGCALMLDRRALSLRAVAMAALIVLVWQPEALIAPGFQMSFAATTALVAVFELVTRHRLGRDWPRWTRPLLSLVLSSAVAGFATAPVRRGAFQPGLRITALSRTCSRCRVMGLLVMPAAVVAGLLMPLGLRGAGALGDGLGARLDPDGGAHGRGVGGGGQRQFRHPPPRCCRWWRQAGWSSRSGRGAAGLPGSGPWRWPCCSGCRRTVRCCWWPRPDRWSGS